MRIGFLTTANSWHIPVKTKYFVNQGHEVHYIGIHPGTGQKVIPQGVVCHNIDSNWPFFISQLIKWWKTLILSRSIRVDVLHIVDLKNAHYAFFFKAKKIVLENSGSDVLVLPKRYKWLKLIYKLFYLKADAVVQDSKEAQIAGIECGAPEKFNEIIELGIDFKIFNKNVPKGEARKRLNLGDEKIVFSPRGFTELYNIETIIKSISIVKNDFPNVKYVFCRHYGKTEEAYAHLINKLGVSQQVLFTGFLDNEKELPFFYTDSDVVVSVPSSDSSPRSVYEAMACMTPVIISELPWYTRKFKKDLNVSVVPVKDEVRLAEEIIRILKAEVVLDTESAYRYVEENINMVTHSKKAEKLYTDLLTC